MLHRPLHLPIESLSRQSEIAILIAYSWTLNFAMHRSSSAPQITDIWILMFELVLGSI
jgi:hypothetical protein